MDKAVEGVLNVDKPSGITSHDVVQRVRRVSGLRRIGHAGTLDPLATGVLVLCLGRATRLVEYVQQQRKTYRTTLRLGQATDTFDAEGEIVAEQVIAVDAHAIEAALDAFRGEIAQRAPVYSAIKQGGQPLYKRARAGEVVERPLRTVTIYALELLAWREPLLELRVRCSTGTYIRSLAHDLGQVLGCGAHVATLRRTTIGDFTEADSVPLAVLTPSNWQTCLLPPETAVQHLPRLTLPQADVARLLNGQRITQKPEHANAELVRATTPDGRFWGVVIEADGAWRPRKMFPPTD